MTKNHSKKIYLYAPVFFMLFLLLITPQAYAAQINSVPVVTEQKVTASVSTNDIGVILEVYDAAGKKILGPQTTTGGPGTINATINVSTLLRGITYVLKGKDESPSSGGDTFQVNFKTVASNTVVTGSGNYYYATERSLGFYNGDINNSFFRFTTSSACEAAWQKNIDDKYKSDEIEGDMTSRTPIQQGITKCITSTTVPTLDKFKSELKPYITYPSSTYYYYYIWKDAASGWNGSKGYATKAECTTAEASHTTYGIAIHCGASKTPPLEPANWKTIRDVIYVVPQTQTSSSGDPKTVYTLLAPIGDLKCIDTSGVDKTCASGGIGDYLNTLFKLAIGLCGALAVIMIVINSIQYMGDESVFGKTEAKSKIMSSIIGLFIALGSYALLSTISPDLLGKNGVTVDQVSIEVDGDVNAPIGNTTALPLGIVCSGGKTNIPNISKSFDKKMTYSQDIPKGQPGPAGTIKLDCSGYVNYVLKCAGVPFVNSGTSVIFSGAEKVTSISGTMVNGKELAVGDLLGWRPGDNPQRFKNNGHVMIYVGGGKLADSHGPSSPVQPGMAYGIFSIDKYKDYIKYIKRAQ